MSGTKFQTFIGIGLLIIAVLGFLFTILTNLPEKNQVDANAKSLTEIPRNLFASDNEIAEMIRQLNVPTNLPVVVDPSNLGRSNAFENF